MNQSIKQSIQFLQAVEKLEILVDPDNMLEGAIMHLEILNRRYVVGNESYLLELSKDDYIAWLMFSEKYKQNQELELVES